MPNHSGGSKNRSRYSLFPKYGTLRAREASFETWPVAMPVNPDTLAAAGFVYLGKDDHTRCYFCGMNMKNWEKNDDPWEIHARYSPDCRHVHIMKGKHYVQEVHTEACFIKAYEPPSRPILTRARAAAMTAAAILANAPIAAGCSAIASNEGRESESEPRETEPETEPRETEPETDGESIDSKEIERKFSSVFVLKVYY